MDQDAKDRNHAKVYVGAFHHAMFTTRKTSNDNAGTLPGDEFRSNDWFLLPWDTTVQDDSRIDRKIILVFFPLAARDMGIYAN